MCAATSKWLIEGLVEDQSRVAVISEVDDRGDGRVEHAPARLHRRLLAVKVQLVPEAATRRPLMYPPLAGAQVSAPSQRQQ